MEIKLDVAALEALFPKGTEARVKLQQCVISELAGRVYKEASVSMITEIIRSELRAIESSPAIELLTNTMKEELSKILSSRYGTFDGLQFSAKQTMLKFAKQSADDICTGLINQMMHDAVDSIGYSREKIINEIDQRVAELVPPLNAKQIELQIEKEVTRRISEMYNQTKSIGLGN